MGRSISFEIRGLPCAWQRAGHYATSAGRVATYTKAETRTYQSLVAMEAGIARGDAEMFMGGVVLHFMAMFPVAQGRRKGKHALKEGDHHTSKPDRDNLEKNINDACSKVLWNDDSAVWAGAQSKVWTYGNPKTLIEVHDGLCTVKCLRWVGVGPKAVVTVREL